LIESGYMGLEAVSSISASQNNKAKSPLVSIVCITYNHDRFVSKTLESFLSQRTNFSFEVVIGDDCSIDLTSEIINTYVEQYPSIIKPIIRHENIGMGANLIDCFNRCQGQYIAICEGDDYWLSSDKLQTQVDLMTEYRDINISFHSSYAVEEGQLKKNKIFANYGDKLKFFSLNDVITGGGGFMPTQSLMLRSEILKHAPDWFYEYPIDYFIQILGSVSNGALYIPSVFAAYRVNVQNSWSAQQHDMSIQQSRETLSKEKMALLNLKELGVSESVINKAIAISTFKAFSRKLKIHGLVRSLSTRYKYINPGKILSIASLICHPFFKLFGKTKK